MKKALSVVLSLLLCFSITVCAFAAPTPTVSNTGGTMTLETEVPDNHEITITYNDGGHVLIGGNRVPSGTKVIVPRFDSLRLDIITNPYIYIKKVEVNGEDVTDQMLYGQLTFEHVHTDMNIEFGFKDSHDADAEPEKAGSHSAMRGRVYRGEALFPQAKMDIDFGAMQATTDGGGEYRVEDIQDGLHLVTISDKDGTVLGKEIFSVTIDETVTEPVVKRLDNGTQLVRLPKGTKEFKLDFMVQDDSTIVLRPSIEIPIEPPTTPAKPTISKTGGTAFMNPSFHLNIFAFSTLSFLLLLLPLWHRKKQEEEEQKQP